MKHTNPSFDSRFGVQEVAELLGIVPRTLHRWIDIGHFFGRASIKHFAGCGDQVVRPA